MRARKLALAGGMLVLMGMSLCASAADQNCGGSPLPTDFRISTCAWWPTKGAAARDEYAGAAECAKCHSSIAATQASTPMAQAATRPTESTFLREHPQLKFRLGPFEYQLLTTPEKSVYSVTRGNESSTHELDWAFGAGDFGQTYLYEEQGKFHESQLSFYTAVGGLDVTIGHQRALPVDLDHAAGQLSPPEESHGCFRCHTTASETANKFDPGHAEMGVTCEACHGPGRAHVALARAKMETAAGAITNPKYLTAVDSVDFCGACHRTWGDVVQKGFKNIGVFNVRFQPYRLELSRCWGRGDARLTCIACHNPHLPLVRDAAAYDSKCLACHTGSRGAKPTREHPGKPCPAATKNCVTCHMQKYDLPGAHSTFTDHWIRIVKTGEPYPN